MLITSEHKEALLERLERMKRLIEEPDTDDTMWIARELANKLEGMLDILEPGRMRHREGFTRYEVSSIYCEPEDRFVVSLISTYDPSKSEGVDTPEKAAEALLDLTRDMDSHSTHWCVFDRKENKFHRMEQGEFEDGGDAEEEEAEED